MRSRPHVELAVLHQGVDVALRLRLLEAVLGYEL